MEISLFTTTPRNVSVVEYGVSLVTILLLDFVLILWILRIQWKSFRKNSNTIVLICLESSSFTDELDSLTATDPQNSNRSWGWEKAHPDQWWIQDFPDGGANLRKGCQPIIWPNSNFSRKLHENKRNWTQGTRTYYLAKFFSKTAWKWKILDPGGASLASSLSFAGIMFQIQIFQQFHR